jgi:hypothetical protein
MSTTTQIAAGPAKEIPSETTATEPLLVNAGFIAVEVFDPEDEGKLSSSLSEMLETSPESEPSKHQVFSWPPRPKAQTISWRLNGEKLSRLVAEDAKRFNIDVTHLPDLCKSVRFFLATPVALPFLMVLARVEVNPEKVNLQNAREQLRRISVPVRVFLEKLGGLSAQGASWSRSPRVACITWGGLRVDQTHLDEIGRKVVELNQIRIEGSARQVETESIDRVVKSLPLVLTDPSFPIMSYMIPFQNVHLILGQSDQPGFGHFRTPSLVWLTTDDSFVKMDEDVLLSHYFGSFGFTDLMLPIEVPGMLTWLTALNIWANAREIRAFDFDQQVAKIGIPAKDASAENIEETLLKISHLGSNVAVEERRVSSVIRWSSNALKRLEAGPAHSPEIALTSTPGKILETDNILYRHSFRTLSSLADLTNRSLQGASSTLRSIEGEISTLQRHLSDLATLRARDVSMRLNKRLETVTRVLVGLTAILVILTAVLAVKAILGK